MEEKAPDASTPKAESGKEFLLEDDIDSDIKYSYASFVTSGLFSSSLKKSKNSGYFLSFLSLVLLISSSLLFFKIR